MFVFYSINEEPNKSTIAFHSLNSDVFKLIKESVPLMREAKEKHIVVESGEKSEEPNYWEEKSKEALKYDMSTLSYLAVEKAVLPERNEEFLNIVNGIKFTSLIKNSITKAKKSIVCKVKSSFENQRNKEDNLER